MESDIIQLQLDEIIDKSLIKTVFQPIISLRDGLIIGYESLSRVTIKCELDNPEMLFTLAERFNRLWDLELLCRTKSLESAYMLSYPSNKKLFINVNPNIMHDSKFQQGFTKKYLDNYNIKPENIVIEITERNAINDIIGFKKILAHYKQHYKIALDDAGSGYAGLNLICDTDPDYIKLDMKLIRDINQDKIKYALVKSMVELSRLINKNIIAEGIETEEELSALVDLGVQYGQGYFIGKPNEEISPIGTNVIEILRDINQKKNHKFGNLIANIYIGNLCKSNLTVDKSILIEDVYNIFLKNRDLLCICVIEDETVIGVITRAKLSQLMSGQYGYSLYQKKQISKVVDNDFLEVDYQMPISSVSRLAMARNLEKLYDSIIVTKESKFLGVVTIKDLLEKTTEIEVVNAKHQNPLSGLPGNVIIEQNITQCLSSKAPFSALYLDLDNFKSYNDVYGFEKGDTVIKLLAHIIESNTPADGFKGHIGGDDFIIIIYDHNYTELCEKILNEFDTSIKNYYSDLDIANGYIETKNRRGIIEKFPIMTLSIAGITNKNQQFEDIFAFSEKLAVVKKQCKKICKSNFCFC